MKGVDKIHEDDTRFKQGYMSVGFLDKDKPEGIKLDKFYTLSE